MSTDPRPCFFVGSLADQCFHCAKCGAYPEEECGAAWLRPSLASRFVAAVRKALGAEGRAA